MKTFKTVPSFTMPIDTTVSSGEAFVGGGHFIMEEIWKDINGYEGVYQISNLGRVKSSIILKTYLSKFGYAYCMLYKNKKPKNCTVHRLVAKAFITNYLNKEQVNHINGIKNDNRVENLEWCTRSENQLHSYRIGTSKISLLAKQLFAERTIILKSKKIINLETGCVYMSIKEAANKYGIKHKTLSAMLTGQNKNKTKLNYINN